VDPISDPLLFFLVVPEIEPGPPDLKPRTLTTRPQRWSTQIKESAKHLVPLLGDDETDMETSCRKHGTGGGREMRREEQEP
jgi:hypothetical protein